MPVPKNSNAAQSRPPHSLARLNAERLSEWAKNVTENRAGPARKSLVADTGFAELLLGAGSFGVPVKIVAAPPKADANLVYSKQIHFYLYKLPKTRLLTGAQLKTISIGPTVRDQTMKSLRSVGRSLAGGVGKRSKRASVEGQSPEPVAIAGTSGQAADSTPAQSLPDLLKAVGSTVPRLLAPDGDKPMIFVQVPDWDRAGDAMKMAAMCAVAARPEMNSQALSINLSDDLIKEAEASSEGFTVFLQRRLKRAVEGVLPKADFAFAVDVTDKTYRLHLHGVIIPNEPFYWTRSRGRDRLFQALRKFADNQSKRAVEASKLGAVPEGWGAYSSKYASLVSALISDASGSERHRSTLLTTRPLTQLARDHWANERRDNLAMVMDLARQDVLNRGDEPDRAVVRSPAARKRRKALADHQATVKARAKRGSESEQGALRPGYQRGRGGRSSRGPGASDCLEGARHPACRGLGRVRLQPEGASS